MKHIICGPCNRMLSHNEPGLTCCDCQNSYHGTCLRPKLNLQALHDLMSSTPEWKCKQCAPLETHSGSQLLQNRVSERDRVGIHPEYRMPYRPQQGVRGRDQRGRSGYPLTGEIERRDQRETRPGEGDKGIDQRGMQPRYHPGEVGGRYQRGVQPGHYPGEGVGDRDHRGVLPGPYPGEGDRGRDQRGVHPEYYPREVGGTNQFGAFLRDQPGYLVGDIEGRQVLRPGDGLRGRGVYPDAGISQRGVQAGYGPRDGPMGPQPGYSPRYGVGDRIQPGYRPGDKVTDQIGSGGWRSQIGDEIRSGSRIEDRPGNKVHFQNQLGEQEQKRLKYDLNQIDKNINRVQDSRDLFTYVNYTVDAVAQKNEKLYDDVKTMKLENIRLKKQLTLCESEMIIDANKILVLSRRILNQGVTRALNMEDYKNADTSGLTVAEKLTLWTYHSGKMYWDVVAHVVLTLILLVYTLFGGMLFQIIESTGEEPERQPINETIHDLIDKIRQEHALQALNGNPEMFRSEAYRMIKESEIIFLDHFKQSETVVAGSSISSWNYANAVVFAVTVYTTIGKKENF